MLGSVFFAILILLEQANRKTALDKKYKTKDLVRNKFMMEDKQLGEIFKIMTCLTNGEQNLPIVTN